MCSPYTRGIFVVLQELDDSGGSMPILELDDKLDQYDFVADYRLSLGVARKALQDLIFDGSLEILDNNLVTITPSGIRTKILAKSYMSSK